MKFDFESLTAEPLIYMLMHSGAFVCVLGGIFFIVGMLFGFATWGRYKRQTKALLKEVESMKGEIADLKRKIADHAVKSGPVIAMATETIHMPKKEASAAPAAEAVPAVTTPPAATAVVKAPPAAVKVPPPASLNLIKPKAVSPPAPAESVSAPASSSSSSSSSSEPAKANPWVASSPSERHVSPLASIIATHPHERDDEGSAEAEAVAIPSELSVSPLPEIEIHAEPEIKPENKIQPEPVILTETAIKPMEDSKLGSVYQTRPEKVDDLTALNGVAQGLEQRLNELGVYTYAQIAGWNEDHVREFSSRLAFKDRIQREQWVEQAAKLAAGGKKAA